MIWITVVFGILVTVTYFASDKKSGVDQYSWERHAGFLKLRKWRAFPLKLDNNFLAETCYSGYPQFFIYLYAVIGSLGKIWAGRFLYMVCLTAGYIALGMPGTFDVKRGLFALVAICSSPLIVSINRQILPRYLGDLLVSSALGLVLLGSYSFNKGFLILTVISYIVLGLHKMSLQLLAYGVAVALPVALGVGALIPLGAFVTAAVVYVLIFPGKDFAVYQFSEHFEILRFWKRNIIGLGSKVFAYNEEREKNFLGNVRRKLWERILLAVTPLVLLGLSMFEEKMVPLLTDSDVVSGEGIEGIVRLGIAVSLIILLSVVCTTKRYAHFGSGLFYLTVPYILGVTLLTKSGLVGINGLCILIVLNSSILLMEIRKNFKEKVSCVLEDSGLISVCRVLALNHKVEKVGIFPFNLADKLEFTLKSKKVLWGAHGCGGWRELEDIFPVMRLTSKEFMSRFDLDAFVVHKSELQGFEKWVGNDFSSYYQRVEADKTGEFSLFLR